MLCWRSGRRSAGQAESRQNAGRGRRPGRWPGHRSNSHAPDFRSARLIPFIEDSVAPGSVVHTDGWLGYSPLKGKSFSHQITYLKGKPKAASELLPRVHLVISLLKRWLMGTHQGAVSHKHLDYYLDEFTFRFNRRRSRSRGKLFFRLAQQAVAVDPVTRHQIVHPETEELTRKTQPLGAW